MINKTKKIIGTILICLTVLFISSCEDKNKKTEIQKIAQEVEER